MARSAEVCHRVLQLLITAMVHLLSDAELYTQRPSSTTSSVAQGMVYSIFLNFTDCDVSTAI